MYKPDPKGVPVAAILPVPSRQLEVRDGDQDYITSGTARPTVEDSAVAPVQFSIVLGFNTIDQTSSVLHCLNVIAVVTDI